MSRRAPHGADVVRSRTLVLALAVVCATALVIVPLRLPSHAAVRPTVVLAVDMTSAFSAFLVSLLAFGRFTQSRLYRHVLLAAAMAMFGVSATALTIAPALTGGDVSGTFGPRALTGLIASLLFALSIWVPAAVVPSRHPLRVVAMVTLLLTLVALLVARAMPELHPIAGPAGTVGASGELLPSLFQGASALLFVIAAFGALRPVHGESDVLMGWLSAGAVMAAFSRIALVAATAQDSTWVVVGMAFRLGFYLLLLGGAVQEIRWYWARATEAAVLEERRRIARDLHDGLAQELAFVASQSRLAAVRPSAANSEMVWAAAQRALDEARRAIAAMTRPLDEPLDAAVAQEVEEVARRFGTDLALELEPGIVVSPDRREALLRIAREAVTNAARHGGGPRLRVELANHDGVTLRVTDEGVGFDTAAESVKPGRLGITSMRERAQALGGTFTLTSKPGRGTVVEVRLP